jgi:dienelactone hydrolase
METKDVEYRADGVRLVGRLALPAGEGKRPAVLIAHEGPGLDDEQKRRAERYAALGYVTFALDYHGGGQPLASRDEMTARLGELMSNPARTRALATAGLEALRGEPRSDATKVAAVGYCFGGSMALDLACSGAALNAVVGFHPGLPLLQPADAGKITARVLVCVGADDPIVTPARRIAFEEQMRAGGVRWSMELYGGVQHSFTHPRADLAGIPGIRYDAWADARSWQAMRELFTEAFA